MRKGGTGLDRFRKYKESDNFVISAFTKVLFRIGHIVKESIKFVIDKRVRALILMQLLHGNRVQQTTQLTWENRYPDVFSACKSYFEERGERDIRILSYGCCTGEEVMTLREYFPEATIVGAEINKNSLKICRSRQHDDKIYFVDSVLKKISALGPYDLIFCMAVLQRTPHVVEDNHITDISDLYPFDKFEKQVKELDSYLKNNGVVVLQYTQYDILDTRLADSYEELGDIGYDALWFDRNSKLKGPKSFHKSMYLKKKEG